MKSSSLFWLGGIALAFLFLASPTSGATEVTRIEVDRLNGNAARVKMPSGRVYLVTSLGDGSYNVARIDVPDATLTFDQSGPTLRMGNTKQLEADMLLFPKDLFT